MYLDLAAQYDGEWKTIGKLIQVNLQQGTAGIEFNETEHQNSRGKSTLILNKLSRSSSVLSSYFLGEENS